MTASRWISALTLMLLVHCALSCQNPLAVDGKAPTYRLGEGPSAHAKRLRSTSSRWQDLNSVDYLAPAGTRVAAIVDGTICATCVYGKTEAEKKDKYSLNSFTLNGSDGTQYYYTHLASITVPAGAKVRMGQVVGTIGAYNGKNPHLHLAIPKGNVCELLRKCSPQDTRNCK